MASSYNSSSRETCRINIWQTGKGDDYADYAWEVKNVNDWAFFVAASPSYNLRINHPSGGFYWQFYGSKSGRSSYNNPSVSPVAQGNSHSGSGRIYINRGSSKTGSATVGINMRPTGVDTRSGGFYNLDASCVLYTNTVSDPSGITFNVTQDGQGVAERKIHIVTKYTNPSSFYYARILVNGEEKWRGQENKNLDIPITYDMFNKNLEIRYIIWGKDNSESYKKARKYTVYSKINTAYA